MSLRIVPAAPEKNVTLQSTANALSSHETLLDGDRNVTADMIENPLQHRLENWARTQDQARLTMQQKMFGLHAPLQRLMERKMLTMNPAMALSPECNVHLDVLMGRDERLDVHDVFSRSIITDSQLSTRRELEKRLNF